MQIISELIVKVLLKEKAQVEFVPITLLHKGRNFESKKFFILNILDTVKCFNFTESDYEALQNDFGEEFIISLYKVVLHPVDTRKHKLFRLKEVYDVVCIASSLADKVIKSGCTGIIFVNPGERWFRE